MTTKWNKKRILRKLKTLFNLESTISLKVREATSNAPWIANEDFMAEISLAAARGDKECVDVMKVVFGRLTDRGRNWRHVYKSLILLDYLVRTGPPLVLSESLYRIQDLYALETFEYVDEDGRDQGMHIRSKSAALIALINRKGLYENPDTMSDVLGSGPLQFPDDATAGKIGSPTDGVKFNSGVGRTKTIERDLKENDEENGKSQKGVTERIENRVKTAVDELDPLSKVSSSKKSSETVLHGGSQRRRESRRRHTVTVSETNFKPPPPRSSSIEPFPSSYEFGSPPGESPSSPSTPNPNPVHTSASARSPLHSLATTRGPRSAPARNVDRMANQNWMPPIISS